MKVKVIKTNLESYWYADKIGQVFEVTGYHDKNQEDFVYEEVNREIKRYFHKDDVEIINEEKEMQFTKDMLQTGMRVIHGKHPRQSGFAIVVKDLDQLVFKDGGWNYISSYSDELKNSHVWDVTAVYAAPERDILNFDVCGDLLWKKVDKTPAQVELETLQTKINELQEQAEKLQGLINK